MKRWAHNFRNSLPIVSQLLVGLTMLVMVAPVIAVMSPGQSAPQEKLAGKDPIHNAGVSKQELLDQEIKKLEMFGEDAHGTPAEEMQGQLLVAIGNDDFVEVHQLLKNGASVNQAFSSSGQTPLMAAESLTMAQLLCENGANTSMKDAEGGTVLHYAVSRKTALELIPYLVSQGADINARGWDNETPLFAAVTYFNETRSSQSENIYITESAPETVLKVADAPGPHRSHAQKVVELLATSGADLNAVDDYGYTVLMQCTVADNTDLVALLLELGADTSKKNNSGKTARDIAYDMGRRFLYQMLD